MYAKFDSFVTTDSNVYVVIMYHMIKCIFKFISILMLRMKFADVIRGKTESLSYLLL